MDMVDVVKAPRWITCVITIVTVGSLTALPANFHAILLTVGRSDLLVANSNPTGGFQGRCHLHAVGVKTEPMLIILEAVFANQIHHVMGSA
jgi:hypothetical protein